MDGRVVLAAVVSASMLCAAPAAGGPSAGSALAIVTHPGTTHALTAQSLSEFFRLRRQFWPDRQRVVLVVQHAQAPAHHALLRDVLDLNEDEIFRARLEQRYRGTQSAEIVEVATAREVRVRVARTPGAIGYLWDEEVDATVRAALIVPIPMASAAEQARLLALASRYERRIARRRGAKTLVGVVYRPGSEASEAQRDAIVRAIEGTDTSDGGEARMHASPIAWTASDRAASTGAVSKCDIAYLCGGLLDEISSFVAVTRGAGVLSATGCAHYVPAGVSLGLVPSDGRTVARLALESARSEGADFEAAFLSLAEVIR